MFLFSLLLALFCTIQMHAKSAHPLKEEIQQQQVNNHTSGYYCLCGAGIFGALALILNVNHDAFNQISTLARQDLMAVAGSLQGLIAHNTSNLVLITATYLTAVGITKHRQAAQLKRALSKTQYQNNESSQYNPTHIHLWLEPPRPGKQSPTLLPNNSITKPEKTP